MGIVLTPDKYIHAPGKEGTIVKISDIKASIIEDSSPYAIYFRNPIGFKRLAVPRGEFQFPTKRKQIIDPFVSN